MLMQDAIFGGDYLGHAVSALCRAQSLPPIPNSRLFRYLPSLDYVAWLQCRLQAAKLMSFRDAGLSFEHSGFLQLAGPCLPSVANLEYRICQDIPSARSVSRPCGLSYEDEGDTLPAQQPCQVLLPFYCRPQQHLG